MMNGKQKSHQVVAAFFAAMIILVSCQNTGEIENIVGWNRGCKLQGVVNWVCISAGFYDERGRG